MVMKWTTFVESLYAQQPLPPERRFVLVRVDIPVEPHQRPAIAVGYMKFGGGDPDSPYFVTPSVPGEVIAWCDCLPDMTAADLWKPPAKCHGNATTPEATEK